MSKLAATRRAVLGWTVMGGAAAFVNGGQALASSVAEPAVLVDRRFAPYELARVNSLFPGVLTRKRADTLEFESVRQWRDQLSAKISAGNPLEIVTRWDNSVIFRGLAREAQKSFSCTSLGRGIFHLTIGEQR